MKPIKLKDLSQKDYARIITRSFGRNEEIIPAVRKIMDEVKSKGNKVIFAKYQKRFGANIYRSIQVDKKEISEAYREIDNKIIRSIKQMVRNITAVHKSQLLRKKDIVVKPEEGITVWREWRAIEKVGLYIPGGKAVYPSSVLMSAIPAKIAGCKNIIVCSPPGRDGKISAVTIVAADMVGISNIYKVGGAEAIAAMAYGTRTIPAVYKIFGAGNSYVTAAKILVMEKIAIDMPAGPSEVFIVADETANPAFIAADLLADGEHGGDSACVLLTTSWQIAQAVEKEIRKQLKNLPTKKRVEESLNRYGLIGIADSLDEAIEFINNYAPEHLEIMAQKPEKIVPKIQNAGSMFLGDWTTKSAGDYATGANHVLPTGGAAKMYPPLGVDSFGKWMQVQKCTKKGLSKIRETIETIAEVEQLLAHKKATSIRFEA